MTRKPKTKRPLTWDALAGALGVATRRLYELRAREDAPHTRNVDDWLAYLDVPNAETDEMGEERRQLRVEKQREEVRKLRLANELAGGRVSVLADQMAGEVLDRIMDKLRIVLLGPVPGQIADALDGLGRMDREVTARQIIEKGIRAAKNIGVKV